MYEYAHAGRKPGGGGVASCAVVSSRPSYHNQVMKSLADSEGSGAVIMGKTAETPYCA